MHLYLYNKGLGIEYKYLDTHTITLYDCTALYFFQLNPFFFEALNREIYNSLRFILFNISNYFTKVELYIGISIRLAWDKW